MENRVEVLTNNLEDVRYELEKSLRRSEKLDFRLAEVIFFFLLVLNYLLIF